MPWNYITCQGGQILAHIKSKSDVIKPETYLQLLGMASIFLLPPLIKKFIMKPEEEVKEKKAM